MATARSNFSVWLTVIMTVATAVVVTGILLAPRVSACRASGGTLGSCIHDRLVGLFGEDASSTSLIASSEPSATSSLPGIETSAVSVAAAAPSAASLAASGGSLELDAAAELASEPPEIALATTPGRLSAASVEPTNGTVASAIDLAPQTGTLSANVAPATDQPTSPAATLRSQGGVLTAAVPVEPAPSLAALAEPRAYPTGDTGWASLWSRAVPVAELATPPLETSGVAGLAGGTSSISASTTLTPSPPKPASDAPRRADVEPPRAAKASPPSAKPVTPSPRRSPKADPRYPNVVVLPTPRGTNDSSFATLKVR